MQSPDSWRVHDATWRRGGNVVDVLVQLGVARQIAEEGSAQRVGEPRCAVMTAVLREAGLNQYPDIEQVSDTLTIPDPGCHTSALVAPEREAEMANARRLITIDVRED